MSHVVYVPVQEAAELITTCLVGLSWRVGLVNERHKQITAAQTRQERRFSYEFYATVQWSAHVDGITIDLEVQEQRNNWSTTQCKKKCLELMQRFVEQSERFAANHEQEEPPNRYGSARWASYDEFVSAGYVQNEPDSRRFILGPGPDGELISLRPEDSAMHALVCGPTGSGKTTSVFIPNLCERLQASAIVTEATAGNEPPDLFQKTAGCRQVLGPQSIYYFNPDDMRSNRINPIDSVKTYAQAQSISQLIIDNTTSKNNYGDQVWPKSEANLLAILVAHAAAEKRDLGYVRALLREGPDGLVPVLLKSKVEQVQDEYWGFHNNSREGFRYGVFAGLIQRLALWVNPRIVALTQQTDLDLNSLEHQLFTFYLAVPAQKTHLKPVAALVFNYILQQAEERNFRHPLFLSLDEFTNFGMIPAIAEKLSIIRHKNIGVILGIQDYVQLEKVYGKEDAHLLFSQPGCKVFFRPRMIEVAERISRMAGMTTLYERKMSSSGHIQEKESGRPLIDASEVMAMHPEDMLVFTPRTPPVKMPRLTWQDYKEPVMLAPPWREEIQLDESLVKDLERLRRQQPWQFQGETARKTDMGEPQKEQQAKKSKKTENKKPVLPPPAREKEPPIVQKVVDEPVPIEDDDISLT